MTEKRIAIWEQMQFEAQKLLSEIHKDGSSFDDHSVYQRIYNLMRLANEQDGDWLKIVFTYMCFDNIHKNTSTLDEKKIKELLNDQ